MQQAKHAGLPEDSPAGDKAKKRGSLCKVCRAAFPTRRRSLLAPKKPKDKEKSKLLDDWLNQRQSQLIDTLDNFNNPNSKVGEPPDKKLKTSESGGPPSSSSPAAAAAGSASADSATQAAAAAAASQRLGMRETATFYMAGNLN